MRQGRGLLYPKILHKKSVTCAGNYKAFLGHETLKKSFGSGSFVSIEACVRRP